MFRSFLSPLFGTFIPFMRVARPAFWLSWGIVAIIAVSAVVMHSLARGDADLNSRYTPRYVWSEQWQDEHMESWFAGQLRAMGEPSLWKLSRDDKTARSYRILQMPSFSPAIAARFEVQSDGSARVFVTELDGLGGNEPGKPRLQTTGKLTVEQVEQMDELLHKNGFWHDRIGMGKRIDRQPKRMCMDGVQYVVEVVFDGKYKLVTRHLCSMEDEVFAVLSKLAKLAGVPAIVRGDF